MCREWWRRVNSCRSCRTNTIVDDQTAGERCRILVQLPAICLRRLLLKLAWVSTSEAFTIIQGSASFR